MIKMKKRTVKRSKSLVSMEARGFWFLRKVETCPVNDFRNSTLGEKIKVKYPKGLLFYFLNS